MELHYVTDTNFIHLKTGDTCTVQYDSYVYRWEILHNVVFTSALISSITLFKWLMLISKKVNSLALIRLVSLLNIEHLTHTSNNL